MRALYACRIAFAAAPGLIGPPLRHKLVAADEVEGCDADDEVVDADDDVVVDEEDVLRDGASAESGTEEEFCATQTELRYPNVFSCPLRHCLNPECRGMALRPTCPKKIILLGIHFFREAWHATWGCVRCGCEYGAWDTERNAGVEVWYGVGSTLPWLRTAMDDIYAFKAPMAICKRLITAASNYMLLDRKTPLCPASQV